MKMFLGEYNPNITEGSRVALPKKMREQIAGDSVVVTRGFEKCIYVYDKSDWQEQAEKYIENSKVDDKQAKIRDLERYVYSSATETSIDSQGRIVIPSNLLEYADITGETTVVGVGNRVELWSRSLWASHIQNISSELSNS
ncbi:division/cell wall cluster transcriptional repressor MraZ [Patescibacteria group bacterium]